VERKRRHPVVVRRPIDGQRKAYNTYDTLKKCNGKENVILSDFVGIS
jgi:hypothetical protein